jgi:hypothetical protein
MSTTLDALLAEVKRLVAEGRLTPEMEREQKISWVYGNCKLSNPDITMEMVERAVDEAEARKTKVDSK